MSVLDRPIQSALWLASLVFFGSGVHSDWIYEKTHKPSSLYYLSRNVINYLTKTPAIYKPISATIEPIFGCNLRCTYCGLQLYDQRGDRQPMRTRPVRIEWVLFQRIVDQLPSSIESVTFGYAGEPLLHPQIAEMIDYTKDKGFRVNMFTNGTLLKGDILEKLAGTRLDVMNISVEPDQETGQKYRGIDLNEIIGNARSFQKVKSNSTQIKISLVMHEGNSDRFKNVAELWKGIISNIKISPRMDYDERFPRESCFEPWRGNLNFLTNGDVSPCCTDCGGDLNIGNINESTVEEIVSGDRYRNLMESFCQRNPGYRCRYCTEYEFPWASKRFSLRRKK